MKTDAPSDSEPAPPWHYRLGRYLSTLVLALVFYVLSIGPGFKLVSAFDLPPRLLDVYTPLYWLMDKDPVGAVDPALKWYVHVAWNSPLPLETSAEQAAKSDEKTAKPPAPPPKKAKR